jgi:hypothetical protein
VADFCESEKLLKGKSLPDTAGYKLLSGSYKKPADSD